MRVRSIVCAASVVAALGSLGLAACGERTAEDVGAVESAVVARPARARRLRADGLLPGMARFRGGGPNRDSNPVCASPQLTYFGGPILQDPIVVAVFWSSAVNAAVQANMGQFYSDVTQSSYWSWLHEYDTVGQSPGTAQVILPGTLGGSAVITPLVCAPGGNNCRLTDADVQTELARQIGLGVLPTPVVDCTGNAKTVYMVHFPPNVRLTGPEGQGTSCGGQMGFCGYHYTGTYGSANTPLVYAALMDVFTGPCSGGCGGNATPLANATALASHELAEATTDTDVGLIDPTAVNFEAPGAWYDQNNMCGEIADICDDGSPGDTITVAGRSWVVQQLWSNQQGKCASSGPVLPVCSGTTLTGCRKCSCGDDGAACGGAKAVCETSAANVLFGACEQCTSANDTCTGTATCLQSTTPAADDICSSCTPLTSCPAGDDCGTVPDGCGGMLSCGTCPSGQTCGAGTPSNPNQCGTCVPKTACPMGLNCGTAPDGCGGTIACGTCTAPQTCGGAGTPGVCGTLPCTPRTCGQLGFTCGPVGDGCGNMLFCGNCTPPATCGGGGKPGICGGSCLPVTCAQLGLDCGPAGDGCGGLLQCGTCTFPESCGGGGRQGVCGGCVPTSCAQQGASCGPLSDGCGSVLDCGACPFGEVCGANGKPNQCACNPATCAFRDASCGMVADGCGSMLDCGSCAAPLTCGGAGVANQCGCTPAKTCPAGFTCGEVADGCGGTLACGACRDGEVCDVNQCVASPPDGGATTSSSSSATSASSSSGAGGAADAWIPIYGRAGCAAAPTSTDARSHAAASTAIAALLLLGRRRRVGRRTQRQERRDAAPRATTRP